MSSGSRGVSEVGDLGSRGFPALVEEAAVLSLWRLSPRWVWSAKGCSLPSWWQPQRCWRLLVPDVWARPAACRDRSFSGWAAERGGEEDLALLKTRPRLLAKNAPTVPRAAGRVPNFAVAFVAGAGGGADVGR